MQQKNKSLSQKSTTNGLNMQNDGGAEHLKHVDRELKERYQKVLEDKEQLGKLESELDTLIDELEK